MSRVYSSARVSVSYSRWPVIKISRLSFDLMSVAPASLLSARIVSDG